MNTTFPFDFSVFIGRFQPFHHGHLRVVRDGLANASQMIILVGSSHTARNIRNPWSYSERERMIRGCLSDEENARVRIAPLMDVLYNDEVWVRNVQATVNGLVIAHHKQTQRAATIALVGHSKDHTGYYLGLFPQWASISVENHEGVNATQVRDQYFAPDTTPDILDEQLFTNALPNAVRNELSLFQNQEAYSNIRAELAFVSKYKAGWRNAPYPPTFVTVDAVVIQSGHVLLIERKAQPGKGLWALPGGFLRENERLLDACLRELREETRLKIPAAVLKGHIRAQRVFDDPNRSNRGRTITHAFYIELEPEKTLPKVRGGDDAKHAKWVPLSELDPSKLFEDHFYIIQEMTGV